MRPQVRLWNKGRVSNLWWMVPIIVWLRLFLWFHTQYAVQCIFWVISECVGRLFFSGSGPELFVCSSLWLGSSIMVLLVAVPVLQRFLSEMCQDLAPNFSFVFKKNYLYIGFLHFLPAEDVWLWQENAWRSARKQRVCASVHMDIYTEEISSLGTFSAGPRRLFSNWSTLQTLSLALAGHSHKELQC